MLLQGQQESEEECRAIFFASEHPGTEPWPVNPQASECFSGSESLSQGVMPLSGSLSTIADRRVLR